MAFSFPVFFDLTDKRVLLIGGGFMAEEKLHLLMQAGAKVTIQARQLNDSMEQMARRGEIRWRRRCYQAGDLAGFYLVFSAADHETNARAHREAEMRGVPFNAVDDPQYCRFILPSVHRQGDLTIAVSTNGKCPALAIRIREEIAARYGSAYGEFLAWAGGVRRLITSSLSEFGDRKALWHRLARGRTIGLLESGDRDAAVEEFESTLREVGVHRAPDAERLAS
jgi:siroheme synthase-like protein